MVEKITFFKDRPLVAMNHPSAGAPPPPHAGNQTRHPQAQRDQGGCRPQSTLASWIVKDLILFHNWFIEFDCGLSNSIVVYRIRLWLIEFDCG
jgi:hypothetical protein